jgi:hypothetical protein
MTCGTMRLTRNPHLIVEGRSLDTMRLARKHALTFVFYLPTINYALTFFFYVMH